jgi:DNA-binding MarR family transcriptional regulator
MIRQGDLQNQAVTSDTLRDRLPPQQARVLAEIVRYETAVNEPVRVRWLARRLGLARATVRQHVERLREKGLLQSR